MLSKEELKKLVADCNNCIMNGLYSGDAMLDAAALMIRLTDIYHNLDQDPSDE